MTGQAVPASPPPQIFLPWRGRCYLPEHAAEPLIRARSLAEAVALYHPAPVQRSAGPSRPAHQPTYPRRVAALLRDYRLVELAVNASPPAPLTAPAVLCTSPQATHLPASENCGLIEPLTEREREVLGLLAAGLSNREIAEALVLTPGTVKWHAHNLYGKLGVARRTQAVARAHALGLLNDA